MDLQDFIHNALTDIMNGVRSAQVMLERDGSRGLVNPPLPIGPEGKITHDESGCLVQEVHFDLAVTTTAGKETKGGISVLGGAIGLGASGRSSSQDEYVSRLQFSVPVVLPFSKRTS